MEAFGLVRIASRNLAERFSGIVADSPFCPRCLIFGDLRHTYKVAGKQAFKCGTCKATHPASKFEPSDFTWRENFEDWKKAMTPNFKTGGNIKDELERLEKCH